MKLSLNINNDRIQITKLLDFKIWDLLYRLNPDIIFMYKCIHQTDLCLECILQFVPISFFPSFYIHKKITKENNTFMSESISSGEDDVFIENNCVKLDTLHDHIQITGTDHNVNIDITFELPEESKLLEPAIKNIFKKMFHRIKIYIESL
jgi:hypothetical protein